MYMFANLYPTLYSLSSTSTLYYTLSILFLHPLPSTIYSPFSTLSSLGTSLSQHAIRERYLSSVAILVLGTLFLFDIRYVI
jgi:hypothetical protein